MSKRTPLSFTPTQEWMLAEMNAKERAAFVAATLQAAYPAVAVECSEFGVVAQVGRQRLVTVYCEPDAVNGDAITNWITGETTELQDESSTQARAMEELSRGQEGMAE